MSPSILEESQKAKRGIWKKIVLSKFFISGLIIVVTGLSAYFYYNRQNQTNSGVTGKQQAVVKREDLKIAIEASGKVVARDGVELSFPVSGNLEVSEVYVKEGDKIKKGDKIAAVKTESLEFELRNAYASYQSALANFNSKKAAPTQSEIDKAKAAIDQAQISLDQAKVSLEKTKSSVNQQITNAETNLETASNNLKIFQDTGDSEIVRDAYTSLLTTIKAVNLTAHRALNDSDAILGIDNTGVNDDFESVLGAKNISSLNSARSSYQHTKSLQLSLDNSVASLINSDYSGLDAASIKAEETLTALQNHLFDMQSLLEATITFVNFSQSELDGFKSTISSNRSSVNSAISSLSTSQQAVRNAKSNLNAYQLAYNKALNDLKVTKSQGENDINTANASVNSRQISLKQAQIDYNDLIAPASEIDLASARAQLASAAISVDRAKYNMEQATLISPIDGVVSMLNYKQGDTILSDGAKSMATIINNDTLFIEANIEESDISKLQVGQKAVVSFEAVDGLELVGELSFISLTSETNSNGIVTYLVRVLLNQPGEQIREGMTAAVEFITAGKDDVLTVPVAAVRNIGGQAAVETNNGQIINVTTGFTDGKKVEIISGLEEGQAVIY